jgi:hypothetical protein
MLVDGVHRFTLDFRAECQGVDVTPRTTFSVANALGAFQGSTFQSAAGAAGVTRIDATAGVDHGSTPLTLELTTEVIVPAPPVGAPPNAPTLFGGPIDPNLAPQWVYPPDGVLVPPNLSELEFHFLPQGNSVFALGFSANGVNLTIYTGCNPVGAGCVYLPDQPVWDLLSQGARGQSVKVTLRGTSGASVGSAPPRTLSFGDQDILGGLYYWAASAGGVYRYDFGLRNQTGEPYYTPANSGAMCVGCHALSRNGARIAVGLDVPGPATMRTLDVASRIQLFELGGIGPLAGGGSDFEALTPDGSLLVTTEKGGLTLRQTDTGVLIGNNPAITNADMPDFSADGTQLVFARGNANCPLGLCMTLSLQGASLYTVPFINGMGVIGFGAEQLLVAGSGIVNNYYPSYSPDSRWVVFNRSAVDSYDAMDARVMAVDAAGRSPIDLSAINTSLGNSWPKWAPFSHSFGGATIFWLTFSSRRPYGLRGGTNAQIWMSAVDVGPLGRGADGSYPPFWLPFQDSTTGNHIAQWAETVARAPCTERPGDCMPNEVCLRGVCVSR